MDDPNLQFYLKVKLLSLFFPPLDLPKAREESPGFQSPPPTDTLAGCLRYQTRRSPCTPGFTQIDPGEGMT